MTNQSNCLMNGETQKSHHKRNHGVLHDATNGRHENLSSNRNGASSSHNETSSEDDAIMFTTDAEGTPDYETPPADSVAKKEIQRELSFQDMYNDEVFFDDDEEDSDWEPVQKHIEIGKWFCTNCTMVNLGVIEHCHICGEHKDSGILRQGFFASPLAEDIGPIEDELEVKGKTKDLCTQNNTSNCRTAIGFDERMLLHSEVQMKSHPHPERPNRLRAIAASLATAGIFPGRCYPISAREITREELQMVHTLEHVQTVEITSHIFSSYFTPDTYANEHSARAARLAAGLCADLAAAIFSGHSKNGFALVRPPGHHAGVSQAMGFCLHNNAAVAALAAQVAGAKKVLIVDWDVHHGNGTQEIFDGNKSVLYVSLHRHEGGKFYPGSGAADESSHDFSISRWVDTYNATLKAFEKMTIKCTNVGSNGAEGYCVNVPWSCGGVGDNDYIFAFQYIVLPIAKEFAPDFTIISAGFDAARGDPLGCCDVTPSGYAHMTDMLYKLSGGKLLVILEGGYNLRSISSSATAVIEVLLGEVPEWEEKEVVPSKAGLKAVLDVLKVQLNYWPSLRSSFEQLESRFAQLQSLWQEDNSENKKTPILKRRRSAAPTFWKYGRKRLLYHFLRGHLRVNQRGTN